MDDDAGVFAGGRLKPSGPSTLEIDHIVSLELGGSNDIANLYPEEATLPANAPGFHIKDRLENKLHDLVCDGTMTLRSVQRQIAEKLAGTLQVGVRSHSDWLGRPERPPLLRRLASARVRRDGESQLPLAALGRDG
ncbi:MAG: HNH endonuclease signature motif containing protein [Solirubrobacteraceae bacterium]